MATHKITFTLKKNPENSRLLKIIKYKETRRIKEGEDKHRLQTKNLKNLG